MPLDPRDPRDTTGEQDSSGPITSGGDWPLSPVLSLPTGAKAGSGDGGARFERMSHQHIVSAHHFAEGAQVLEGRDRAEITQDDRLRHRAFVTAAVLSSAAFLEASINELYLELQKMSHSAQPNLRRELAMLPRVWPQIARSPVLHKYQLALSVADGDQYDESRLPFLDADSLAHLRDALLSYRPDWEDRRGRHRTLEKRLHMKFPPNALAPPQAPWFPERCLGAGCAIWAVRTVELFSDDFCHRMAIPARPLIGREGAA